MKTKRFQLPRIFTFYAILFIFGISSAGLAANKYDPKKQVYIFTDDDGDPETIDEAFDSEGQHIEEFEYREQYEQESKDLQDRASKPFGQAQSPFGSAWTSAEEEKLKKIEQKSKDKEKEKSEAVKSPAPSPTAKPKVLIA